MATVGTDEGRVTVFASPDGRNDGAGSDRRGRGLGAGVRRVPARFGALVALVVAWSLVASASASADQASFFYTGARQSFTVPNKVTSLDIVAEGGEGGAGLGFNGIFQGTGGFGGAGALVEGTLAVVPGEQLTIDVGQNGGDGQDWPGSSCSSASAGGTPGVSPFGFAGGTGGDGDGCGGAGGGGGAASDVVVDGTTLMVAAGGGGGGGAAGFAGVNGGNGGDAGRLAGFGLNGGPTGASSPGGTGGNGGFAPTDQGTDGGAACTACDSGGGGAGGGGDRGGAGGGAGGSGLPSGAGGGAGSGSSTASSLLSDVDISTAPTGVIGGGNVLINFRPPDATSTVVSCSPDSVAVDAPTSCSATVTDTVGFDVTTPTGTVMFGSDGAGSFDPEQCSLSQISVGVARCSISYTPAALGSQAITGGYGGDAKHVGSSGTQDVAVTVRSASTSVGCSPDPVAVGQATACVVTVTDTSGGSVSTPTGSVGVSVDGGQGSFGPGSCDLSQVRVGVSSCSVSYTPSEVGSGSRTFLAQYSGDAIHQGGFFSIGFGSVNVFAPRSTSTSVECSPDPVAVGQASSCVARVSDTDAGSAITPTGTVSFGSTGAGGFSAKECSLSGSGVSASCSVSYTPSAVGSGSHTVSADYGGDATHVKSSGSQAVGVIAAGSSTTGVKCAPASVVAGQASKCTATVRDTNAGAKTPPTGSVKFTASAPGRFSADACVLKKTGAAVARCTVSFTPLRLGALTVTITGDYAGDATHPPSRGIGKLRVAPEAACANRVATLAGSALSDRLRGTRHGDVIAAAAGNDRIVAGDGNDLVCGGPGNDRVLGGRGNDHLYGGLGNDHHVRRARERPHRSRPGSRLRQRRPGQRPRSTAVDGQRDVIDCGPGHDTAIVDPIDQTRHCETVITERS